MALTDWKKTNDYTDDNWYNIKKNKYLVIPKIYGHNPGYRVVTVMRGKTRVGIQKVFKTKSQALAYARAYMRKH